MKPYERIGLGWETYGVEVLGTEKEGRSGVTGRGEEELDFELISFSFALVVYNFCLWRLYCGINSVYGGGWGGFFFSFWLDLRKLFETVNRINWHRGSLHQELTPTKRGGPLDTFTDLCKNQQCRPILPPHTHTMTINQPSLVSCPYTKQ